MMLDKENLQRILNTEWDNYRSTVEKLSKPIVQENDTLRRFYERRERLLLGRIEGMEDLLYDLGYLALKLPSGDIDIVERG